MRKNKRLTYRELVEWMPDAAEQGLTQWDRCFAWSIVERTRDRPRWQPSKKQAVVMRRIVQDIQDDGVPLIDHTDRGDWNTQAA